MTFALAPISSADADRLRREGGERYTVDAMPGYPCRQCLRDAGIGETVILVSHDPFDVDSPYRSASPIFLHAEPCAMDEPAGEIPLQLSRRTLSVRAFGADAMMTDATVVPGADLSAVDRPPLRRPDGHPPPRPQRRTRLLGHQHPPGVTIGTGYQTSRADDRAEHGLELGLGLGKLGVGVAVGDDAAAGDEAGRHPIRTSSSAQRSDTAQRPLPCAVAPSDRAAVHAALEALDPVDQLDRNCSRG